MDGNPTMSGTGLTSQAEMKSKGALRVMALGIQPTPTITPEKIGCVMIDVQAQIDSLQAYLIELGLAKTRVTLHGKQGWGHGDRDPS